MKIANRYEPTGSTAAGGMGEIVECVDSHLQRRVVIKRLKVGIDERRLIDEQKALAKLRSKHVVQLYDIVELDDRGKSESGIVLEFIEGKNLASNMFAPDRDYLYVLWQIASGLKEIHEGGIIHRDIKPANIRMDKEKVIKILDFGLARSDDEGKTRSIIGTPVFMAPELWAGSTISFDRSIDVYAFGATALALLTDKPPGELVHQPPRPVSLAAFNSAMTGLPLDIVTMLHSCLESNPAKRPSMAGIQAVLGRHLLANRHRALVIMNGQVYNLDSKTRKVTIKAGKVGELTIEYNSLDFAISKAVGAVTVNNSPAVAGSVVPGCCVITFGGDGQNRVFVTFDVSHPEVMS